MLREVSVHHGSLKVEPNEHAHHHLVCTRCKQITDLDEESLGVLRIPIRMKDRPRGFQVTRIAIDVLGICAACAAKENSKQSSFQTKRR
jgi:Fur family peroxide stress response transcriptional regulator